MKVERLPTKLMQKYALMLETMVATAVATEATLLSKRMEKIAPTT